MPTTSETRYSMFDGPAWRWERAVELAGNGRRLRNHDDDWVRLARRFATAAQAGNKVRRQRETKQAALAAAHDLWQTDPPYRRWLLEAALTAGESVEQVAQRCCLEPAVVEAYESIFFDVRPRLPYRDWVTMHVIGLGLPSLLRQDYPSRIWKLFGYHGGSHILDIVIAATTGQPLPEWFRVICRGDSFLEARVRLKARLSVEILLAETADEIAELVKIAEGESKLSAGYGDGSACSREALAKLQRFWEMLSSRKSKRKRARTGRRNAPTRDITDPLDILN